LREPNEIGGLKTRAYYVVEQLGWDGYNRARRITNTGQIIRSSSVAAGDEHVVFRS
jgi:hypothetical protein